MKFTLVEICSVNHKDAGYYYNANTKMGLDIFQHNGVYYTYIYNPLVLRLAEFSSIESGLYVFKE